MRCLGRLAKRESRGLPCDPDRGCRDGRGTRDGPAHVRAVLAQAAGVPGRPACIVSSGETTVHVTGAGKGGRNQEFALAAALSLWGAGHGEPSPVLASVGTDGVDGPTDAAGAIVDGSTLARARAAGLAPDRFLSTTTPTRFSTRWAISSTRVRPAPTSATSR